MLNERSINNITQQGYSAMRKEKARVYEVSKSLEHVTSSNNSIPLYLDAFESHAEWKFDEKNLVVTYVAGGVVGVQSSQRQ